MHIVIPAYRPGPQLLDVVTGLVQARPSLEVLVVDDGSGSAYAAAFAAVKQAGARVLHLADNHGKGFALRAAFEHLVVIRSNGPVVTADADGQHAVADILRVADAVRDLDGPAIVLGERAFTGDVPLRSRVGNAATRHLFRLATGHRLHDTQTGLRAFPAELLPWLGRIRGDRYEYELTMLLRAARDGIALRSVPIATIYDDGNSTSHFRPFADSVRIYAPLLAFVASSLAAFLIDTVALLALHALTGSLVTAALGARLLSASVNFTVNRHLVFPSAVRRRDAAARYAALALLLLGANIALLTVLTAAGLSLLPAKLLTEALLVLVSYVVQARLVFRRTARRSGRRTPAPAGHRV